MGKQRYVFPIVMNPELARQCRRRAIREGGSLANMVRGLLIERLLAPGPAETFSPYAIIQTEVWGPPETTVELARQLLFIPLSAEMDRDEMLSAALETLSDRLAQNGGELGPYGSPVALELHVSPKETFVFALATGLCGT